MVEHTSEHSAISATTGLEDSEEFAKTSNDKIVGNVIHTQGDQRFEFEGGLNDGKVPYPLEADRNVGQVMEAEDVNDAQELDLHEGKEMDVEYSFNYGQHSELADDKSVELTAIKSGSTMNEHQVSYSLPSDDKSEFLVSDLVWGKVKSHPWWPGQIFDPLGASEKAIKYQKKDYYLVAYFGDRTFAWNEALQLKSFMSHFSQVEKQSSSEAFQNAVGCALKEVSRRVELGLACSCTPKDVYDKIKIQSVDNAGIREELSTREGVDKSMGTDLFVPAKLVEYMRELAQFPRGDANQLDLVIARSQLLAFYQLKGYTEMPEFQSFEDSLENMDALDFEDKSLDLGDDRHQQTQKSPYRRRKHNLKASIHASKKERSSKELMGDTWDSGNDQMGDDEKADGELLSPPSAKKRKGVDPFSDEIASSERRKTISMAKVSTAPASSPKPSFKIGECIRRVASQKTSFKIGECIRRVASQMTASPSILKSNNSMKFDDSFDGDLVEGSNSSFQLSEEVGLKKAADPADYSSLDELLSQVHLAARDPLKGYDFFNVIMSFFSDFRNFVTKNQHVKLRSEKQKRAGAFPETFEFEDMGDTYWTDRVIQNGAEEELPQKSRKRDTFSPTSRGSVSRKRSSDHMNNSSAEKPRGYVNENAPAELVMHFPVVDSVPSEMSLSKMFRHFGPIKESETAVDRDTNRARVVFKRCLDAEAAYASASKFNIFGQMLVNYQLNYTITIPFKSVPIAPTQGMEDEDDSSLFFEF